MTVYKFLFPLAALTLLAACKRSNELLDANIKTVAVDSSKSGFLKIVHAYSPLTPSVASGTGPKVAVYLDGQPLLRDSLAFNATFPNPSGAYAVISGGAHNLQFILNRNFNTTTGAPSSPPVAGDTVFKVSANVAAGKFYTAFLADSTQSPGVWLVADNFTVPSLNRYQVRVANLVTNANERYDVYADSSQQMVATNIGYREVSNFMELPINNSAAENFSFRRAGTTTVIYTLLMTTLTPQRVYTVYLRGRNGVSGRTPAPTFYTNR